MCIGIPLFMQITISVRAAFHPGIPAGIMCAGHRAPRPRQPVMPDLSWGQWWYLGCMGGWGRHQRRGCYWRSSLFCFPSSCLVFFCFSWGGRDGEVKGKNVWTPECSSIMRSLRFGIQSPWLIVAFFVWPGGVLRKHFSSHIGFGGRFRVLVFVWGGVGVQWFTAPVGMQAVGAYGSECLKVNSLCHLTSTAPTGKSYRVFTWQYLNVKHVKGI